MHVLCTKNLCVNRANAQYHLPVSKTHFLRDFLGPVLILAVPPGVVLFALAFPGVTWNLIVEFVFANWGNLAGVWGLLLGFYLLLVATGARRAAEDARTMSRRQSLIEEMKEAENKAQQMGHFLASGNLEVVRIRAEEVLASCQSVLGRWGTEPEWEKSKNKLLSATAVIRTIAQKVATATGPLSAKDRTRVVLAQVQASEILSAVLAESRGLQERK